MTRRAAFLSAAALWALCFIGLIIGSLK